MIFDVAIHINPLKNARACRQKEKNRGGVKLKYNKGFTLSEVLIALVVIGVIATITMMTIIPTVNEAQTVSQVKSAYSVFSQAFLKAKLEDGIPEEWEIGAEDSQAGAMELYRIFSKQIVKAVSCDTDRGCFADGNYYAMDGKTVWAWNPRIHIPYTRGVLANGTSFALWSAGEGCTDNLQEDSSTDGIYSNVCGSIHIDINGARKPNRAGYDFFVFYITKNGIVPSGLEDYGSHYNIECKKGSNKNTNGTACSGWILAKGNMDYLRRDISNEW